jgi:hypothetical protein
MGTEPEKNMIAKQPVHGLRLGERVHDHGLQLRDHTIRRAP